MSWLALTSLPRQLCAMIRVAFVLRVAVAKLLVRELRLRLPLDAHRRCHNFGFWRLLVSVVMLSACVCVCAQQMAFAGWLCVWFWHYDIAPKLNSVTELDGRCWGRLIMSRLACPVGAHTITHTHTLAQQESNNPPATEIFHSMADLRSCTNKRSQARTTPR